MSADIRRSSEILRDIVAVRVRIRVRSVCVIDTASLVVLDALVRGAGHFGRSTSEKSRNRFVGTQMKRDILLG